MEEAVGTIGGRFRALEEALYMLSKKFDLMLKFEKESMTRESTQVLKASPKKIKEPDVSSMIDGDLQGKFGGPASFGRRFDSHLCKLEMPIFNGSNPNRWILKAKSYFLFHRYSKYEEIEAEIISFEEDTLLWYQWKHWKRSIESWKEFQQVLLR